MNITDQDLTIPRTHLIGSIFFISKVYKNVGLKTAILCIIITGIASIISSSMIVDVRRYYNKIILKRRRQKALKKINEIRENKEKERQLKLRNIKKAEKKEILDSENVEKVKNNANIEKFEKPKANLKSKKVKNNLKYKKNKNNSNFNKVKNNLNFNKIKNNLHYNKIKNKYNIHNIEREESSNNPCRDFLVDLDKKQEFSDKKFSKKIFDKYLKKKSEILEAYQKKNKRKKYNHDSSDKSSNNFSDNKRKVIDFHKINEIISEMSEDSNSLLENNNEKEILQKEPEKISGILEKNNRDSKEIRNYSDFKNDESRQILLDIDNENNDQSIRGIENLQDSEERKILLENENIDKTENLIDVNNSQEKKNLTDDDNLENMKILEKVEKSQVLENLEEPKNFENLEKSENCREIEKIQNNQEPENQENIQNTEKKSKKKIKIHLVSNTDKPIYSYDDLLKIASFNTYRISAVNNYILNILILILCLKVTYDFCFDLVQVDLKMPIGIFFLTCAIVKNAPKSRIILYESVILIVFIFLCVLEYFLCLLASKMENEYHIYFLQKIFEMIKFMDFPIKKIQIFRETCLKENIFYNFHNIAFLIWAFFTHSLSFNMSKTKILKDHLISILFLILLGVMRYFTYLKTENHFLIYPFFLSRLKLIFLQIITFRKVLFNHCKKHKIFLFVIAFIFSLIEGKNMYILKSLFFILGFIEMYLIVFYVHYRIKGFGYNLMILFIGICGMLYGLNLIFVLFVQNFKK